MGGDMPGPFSSPLSWFSASASHRLDLPTVQKQGRWGGVASAPDPCHSCSIPYTRPH